MRIIRLQASNIKKINVIDITPNKYINRLSGKNGSGKTSVLDLIEWGMVGGKNVPTVPIRRGENKGVIRLGVGESETEVVLTRQFFEGSAKRAGRLNVEQRPGADASEFQEKRKKLTTPEELEEAVLKQVSFDPLEFMRMDPKRQYYVLRGISTPNVDLDAMDTEIQTNFAARTEAKRKRDELEAQRNAIQVPADLPTEPRDVSAMVTELAQVGEYNAAIERERNRQERILQEIRTSLERVQRLQKELLEAEADYESLKGIPDTWKPLAEPKDAAALAEEIEQARIINRSIEKGQIRAKIEGEFVAANEVWEKLDAAVKEGEAKKSKAIEESQFPVEGLGFGNQEVTYKGLPFEQASTGEQIRVSTAIGMSTSSKVRVMRIKDGSLLDDDSLAIIAELAQEKDFQVWIECVDNTGNVGFYLEDGEVTTVNEEPLDKPPVAAAGASPKKASAKKSKKIAAKA